jgi:hypothetical protein
VPLQLVQVFLRLLRRDDFLARRRPRLDPRRQRLVPLVRLARVRPLDALRRPGRLLLHLRPGVADDDLAVLHHHLQVRLGQHHLLEHPLRPVVEPAQLHLDRVLRRLAHLRQDLHQVLLERLAPLRLVVLAAVVQHPADGQVLDLQQLVLDPPEVHLHRPVGPADGLERRELVVVFRLLRRLTAKQTGNEDERREAQPHKHSTCGAHGAPPASAIVTPLH